MKHAILKVIGAVLTAAIPASGFAQFVDDEFNGVSLGPQWTQVDGTPAGSNFSLTGSQLRIEAQEGTDHFMFVDNYAYVQQNAPTGNNWEVVVKIDNYDPTQPGFRRRFLKSGIQLWQDNDHWALVSLASNDPGTSFGFTAQWQTDAVPPNDVRTDGVIQIFPQTPGGTFYLKLIKTSKGYLGQVSADGVNFQNILPLLRNPDTANGFFTNEKIRLFQAGGDNPGLGVVSPVLFDYARSATLPAPTAGYQDDEFNGTSLGSHWKVHEGVLSGTLTMGGGTVNLTSGDFQDLWENVYQAMHIYQDAPTSNTYDLTIKCGPTNMIPFEQWNCYGIKLWQDQCNWLFITNQRSETGTNRIELAFKRPDLYVSGVTNFGTSPCPSYLRIAKEGSKYTMLYSFDNVTYTPATGGVQTYPAALKNPQVHLFSKRVFAGLGTPVTANFDYIHAFAPATDAQDWQLYE